MDMCRAIVRGIQGALVLGVLSIGCLSAIDIQPFYRAPFFQDDTEKKVKPWTTALTVRVGYGDTTKAFDVHEKKKALLSSYGPFNLTALGIGVESVLDGSAGPTTQIYWNQDGTTGKFDHQTFTNGDGTIDVGGRFRNTEYDLTLEQELCWGLYFQAYVPFKDLKIDHISWNNLGEDVIGSGAKTVNVHDFVTTDLPLILQENGYKNQSLMTPFKKSGIADVVVSAGWHSYTSELHGIVDAIGGFVQGGMIIPCAGPSDENILFSLPLGADQHLGCVLRGGAEFGFWKFFKLGAQAGTEAFFTEEKRMRMMTDKTQSGWILLDQGHTNVDTGGIWDVAGYLKVDNLIKGLEAIVGYSFTRQESTRLHVKDDDFLKTVIARDQASGNYSKSKDDIVNFYPRLAGWEVQTMHFVVQYVPHVWRFNPILKAEYDYPILGKYNFATAMAAGTLGISASWCF